MWFFSRHRKEDEAFYNFFKNILGFTPRNRELYRLAFLHRSQRQLSVGGHCLNNERLEYLGDAILGAIVADYLYRRYPNQDEGFLTETRSKIVSRANLGQVAHKIGLAEFIEYNHQSKGIFKSMAGDTFEALVGAIYIERGFQFTHKVIVNRILALYVDVDSLTRTNINHKGQIIDWGQKNHHKITFELLRTLGNGRARRQYECGVAIDGKLMDTAVDYTIKAAEQRAAEKTLLRLAENEAQPA